MSYLFIILPFPSKKGGYTRGSDPNSKKVALEQKLQSAEKGAKFPSFFTPIANVPPFEGIYVLQFTGIKFPHSETTAYVNGPKER